MNAMGDTALTAPFSRQRLLQGLSLVLMRTGGVLAKFLLAIYTARYLGLSDLGIYGLLAGAVNIMPAVAGFGMTHWIVRKIVNLPRSEALPIMANRLCFILSIHLIVQPIALAVNFALGEPIPLEIALLCGAILLLENLSVEATDMVMARGRILLSYGLSFLRAGVWPYPVIALGILYPETRTLEFLLFGWLGTLILSWIIIAMLVIPEGRWRYLRPNVGSLLPDLHGSLVLYVKDLSWTVSMFIDRFVISLFLGLEFTGVYTLFWSIANVVHSLSVYGVLQAQLPQIISTAQTGDRASFRALERRLGIETGAWALLLTLAAAVAIPLLLPYLDQPLLKDYLPVFWIILAGTLLRVAADAYGFALLALHRDRAIAVVGLAGAIASAVLNFTLTPLAGLWGASFAYFLTSGGLFAARYWLSRHERTPAATPATEPLSYRPD